MTRSAEHEVARLRAREPGADLAALWDRVEDLSDALEHVLDVLEALAQSHEHIDWHVQEARAGISGHH